MIYNYKKKCFKNILWRNINLTPCIHIISYSSSYVLYAYRKVNKDMENNVYMISVVWNVGDIREYGAENSFFFTYCVARLPVLS